MIRNEHQSKVAKKKLLELTNARDSTDDATARRTYTELIQLVSLEISEYEAIRARVVRNFAVESVDDLGGCVIKARISSGMSQRELSDELGVSEQMVQKDEARSYENAGLAKIAEVLDVLGFELVGCVRPRQDVRDWIISVHMEPALEPAESTSSGRLVTASESVPSLVSEAISTPVRKAGPSFEIVGVR
jgi:ribosome-binding protein aMBF1 (putative translation factor)